MKKVLALLLCLTMLATLTVAIAAATTADGEETTGIALDNNGEGAVIKGETIEVDPADGTFTYEISIENNPGIASAILVVSFDNTKITCTKAAAGKVFKAYEDADENEIIGAPQFVSGPQDLTTVGEINLVVASTGEYNYDLDGVVAKLTFQVNEGVQVGDEVAVNIAIDYENTYAFAEDQTTEFARDAMTVESGKVVFAEAAAPTTAAPTTAAPTTAAPTTAAPTTAAPTTAAPTTAAPTTAAPTTAAPTTVAPTTEAPTTATPTTAAPTTEGTPSTGDSMLVYVAIAIVAATAVVAFSMKKREN